MIEQTIYYWRELTMFCCSSIVIGVYLFAWALCKTAADADRRMGIKDE